MIFVWVIRLPRIMLGVGVGNGACCRWRCDAGNRKKSVGRSVYSWDFIWCILGATLSILLGVGVFRATSVGFGAFVGAMTVSFAVIAIANIGGRITSIKLVLTGVALSSMCSAISNFIVYVQMTETVS